jgi:hypothetical protein
MISRSSERARCGCSYCYARPTHEFLGFSANLDFESKIMGKEDAPELLRRELSSPKLNNSEWGKRFSGEGIFAEQPQRMFEVARRKAEIQSDETGLSTAAFRRAGGTQLSLSS